jgi:hypothetical protein
MTGAVVWFHFTGIHTRACPGKEPPRESPGDIHLSARDLARQMRIDPSAGERKIQFLETVNIEKFALGPTLSNYQAT